MIRQSNDLWQFLRNISALEAKRIRHCRGCIYLASCGHVGCCQYILIADRRRPCPAGKGCTVKIVREGYRFPDGWDEWVAAIDAEEEEKAREEAERERQRQLDKEANIAKNPSEATRGRKAGWDTKYAYHLYINGFYLWEIAEVLGVPITTVHDYAYSHEWHLRKKLKPLCNHDLAEARETYRLYKSGTIVKRTTKKTVTSTEEY